MTTMSMPRVAPAAEPEKAKKGRLKWIIAVVLAIVLGGVAFVLLNPTAEGEKKPVAGEVVALDPIQVNLAAGHYLRVGIALQLVDSAHEVEGSKALDAAINVFSGRQVADVSTTAQREALRTKLVEQLELAYHGDVMGLYFTEFVIQ
ncbi:flagellar basal body-associated FliL family protein [Nocardioides yefusunii]|uniref:Flagellar protein FliL n=1 Tax=Nocardioides yefusunii TaxID=2500546 RepID=A0ABW1R1Y8_9ACTN|nr:flagellar basal body-associated FliL family protein [Nocardioides yefusunii]